ncbi:MAG: MFS transporter [Alphaproteobacteria bacterium]|jgi:MFS family permease|nr:MFS transporter [Alphaproteobacteria bacterium]MBT5390543.1 MFS transporter [Alphaproteobacteria bacterium]
MTPKIFCSVIPPLLSMFFLMNGVGLFGTFIPIRLEMESVSSLNIGLITSAYYTGMALGAFKNANFILRVGHIRAYAAFASLTAVVMLSQGLFYSLWYWILLRAISGYCLAGLYIVVESWLLGHSTVKTRGQFLALYMIALYGASASGQFLLNVFNIDSLTPFSIATIFVILSVIPLAITKVGNPTIEEPSALTLIQLYKLSPTGIVSCTCSGLLLGSVLGLLPLYTQTMLNDVSVTALIMFLLIAGGTALQYPIGRLSDLVDRRKMLIFLCFLLLAIELFIITISNQSVQSINILIFIFGGASFALYPVSISHTCDVLEHADIVSATQGLMLAYGIGAIFGPIFASVFMSFFGSGGLFIYFIFISVGLAAYLIYRVSTRIPSAVEDHQDFVVLPGTTPIASELDPRSDE